MESATAGTTWDPTFDYDPYYDSSMFNIPLGSDIATRFPRHVASRLLRLNDGETIWRPAADIFGEILSLFVKCYARIHLMVMT
jgi:hypothetical protein